MLVFLGNSFTRALKPGAKSYILCLGISVWKYLEMTNDELRRILWERLGTTR